MFLSARDRPDCWLARELNKQHVVGDQGYGTNMMHLSAVSILENSPFRIDIITSISGIEFEDAWS